MSRNLNSAIARLAKKALARMRSVVRRGVMSNINSTKPGQTLQTKRLPGQIADDVEHFEPYGFTSSPPLGSEGLLFSVGGDAAHVIGINFGNRQVRFTALQSGEVAMYHQGGTAVVLRTDGSVEISTMPLGSSVVLNADGSIDLTPSAGQKVNLTPGAGAQPIARQTDPVNIPGLEDLQTAINGWIPAGGDGGAALKTALTAWLADLTVGDGTITAGGTGSTST